MAYCSQLLQLETTECMLSDEKGDGWKDYSETAVRTVLCQFEKEQNWSCSVCIDVQWLHVFQYYNGLNTVCNYAV